ncbi:rod shape-determining protein MreC [uncultured Hydrogenophaga sp.]|uniref:rod shape-determining protein MreC n=1 Tax=uncultured Hydrogenophaga sp. TaxID=199683 RepID=UPI00266028E0|nr:rod shape-determining protein MreC [uncultured Hydrogenophaga sp.]
MPLGTLDRTPPPFFKQGPSALSKLVVFSAIALFLMVADLRFKVTAPLRTALAAVIYPGQWLVMQPIEAAMGVRAYFTSLEQSRTLEAEALQRLARQADRSQQVEQLTLENRRLRELLGLRERAQVEGIGAQVLYDAADPYTRRVVIDRGQTHGVKAGAPVIDEAGVLGQVTRVYPLVSEVSLLVDPDQAIPVLNARTGLRSIAFGQPSRSGDSMELRYTVANADIAVGDLLTTSGVDGVYPPGLSVARVTDIERAADSSFARIRCEPVARVQAALHVIVLQVSGEAVPAAADGPSATGGKASP